jgi:spermidine synthase
MSYASTSMTAARYMTTLANLAMLSHPAPKDALVVCFGTGTTAATFARYDELRSLTIVDLNEDVLRAAPFFVAANHDVTHDPRAHVIVDDGRHHLVASSEQYDVISFEPPPPITAGTVSLYSREFYALAASRLRPDGVLTQWIPLQEQSDVQNKMLVRAMLDVFPDVALFLPSAFEAVIVASRSPIKLDFQAIRDRASAPRVAAGLRDVGFDSSDAMLATLVSAKSELPRWVGDASAVTDDLPAVEYALLRAKPPFSIAALLEARTPVAALSREPLSAEQAKRLDAAQAAAFELARGAGAYMEGHDEEARASVAKAVDLDGANAYTRYASEIEYGCLFPFR